MKDFEFEAASVDNLEKRDSKELLDLLKSKKNKNDAFFYAVSNILSSRDFICDEFPPIKKEISEKNNKKIIRAYLSIRSNCDKDRDIIEYIAILQIIKERGMDPRFFIEEPLPSDDFIVNSFKNLTSSLSKFITKKKERINGDSSKLIEDKDNSIVVATNPGNRMQLKRKIGIWGSCMILLGMFLPVIHFADAGAKVYVSYMFVNPFPLLITVSATVSFFALKLDKPRLLWVSSVLGVVVVSVAFYGFWSNVNLLQDGYETLRKFLPENPKYMDPPRLGIAWAFILLGSFFTLFSAATTGKSWELEHR